MKRWVLCFILMAFLPKISMAEDYLLDSSAMSVGATAGENLIIKEGCLNPTQTTCTEKVKWLTAPLTKIGNLEVVGSFTGDFEISLTININAGSKGIVLLTPDNKSIEYNIAWDNGFLSDVSFFPKGDAGSGGGLKDRINGWNDGNTAFNNITLTVQQNVARVYVNGTESVATPITLAANTVFSRLFIRGITSSDRISEVRIRGLKSCGGTCDGAYTQVQMDAAVKAEQMKWDANGDGKIGLEDIIRMLQVLAGLRP